MSPTGPDARPESADERTEERADDLLPEERAAGSDNPRAQAAAILADSDEREVERGEDGEDSIPVEHRTSEETVEP
jgi:hypothetical protein